MNYYVQLLKKVEEHNNQLDQEKKLLTPLTVFAYTKTVDKFNQKVLEKLAEKGKIVTSVAKDSTAFLRPRLFLQNNLFN